MKKKIRNYLIGFMGILFVQCFFMDSSFGSESDVEGIYGVRTQIHPSYGEADIVFSFEWEPRWGFQGGNTATVAIADVNHDPRQALEITWVSVFEPQCYLVDLNFDGYKDILVLIANTNPQNNHYYKGWLWNKNNNSFDRVSNDLPINLSIDPKSKELLSMETTQNETTYRRYKFFGFEIRETARLEVVLAEKAEHSQLNYREFFLKKDKLEFHTDIFEKTDKRAQKKYYSSKSVWRLEDDRWKSEKDKFEIKGKI